MFVYCWKFIKMQISAELKWPVQDTREHLETDVFNQPKHSDVHHRMQI